MKEDGSSISSPYLNDIEHNRRTASSNHLLKEFSRVLEVDIDYLYFLSGRIPEDMRNTKADARKVAAVYRYMRKELITT